MDNSTGLVYRHEEGKDDLAPRIPRDQHQRVVEGCVDVPHERPSFELPLTEVGIAGKTVWVNLPQGRLPFAAKVNIDLPAHRRGIHMSRIEEVMAALFTEQFDDLRDYAVALGRKMIIRQDAGSGSVVLSGKLPIVRRASVSERDSLDTVDIDTTVRLVREKDIVRYTAMNGLGVSHITACPCTQVYNAALFESDTSSCPLPTHSQRSYTRLSVETSGSRPSFTELLACLENALHVTQDLLKRPDEAEIVLKAHRHPQFAEDAVRETAMAVGRKFTGLLPPSSRVIIESLSLESIHIHDVHCRVEVTLGEISKRLQTSDHGGI